MDALLHWPPPENPHYQRECDDIDAWDLDRRMELADREAKRLHSLAVEADEAGRADDAERLLNQRDAAEREWKRLSNELADLDGGF